MRLSVCAFLLGLVLMASAQTRALRVNPGAENELVHEPERVETQLLLDEMQGLGWSLKFQDDFFYRPYLTNVVPLRENEYLVRISYIRIKDGERERLPQHVRPPRPFP